MEPSIAAARAGVTTGEWGATLRRIFGEYRAPTGVAQAAVAARRRRARRRPRVGRERFGQARPAHQVPGRQAGPRRPFQRRRTDRRARPRRGMEVVYEGIRLTPAQIVRAAVDESVHVVGLSILSGSHVPLVKEVMERMRKEGLDDVPRRRRRHHSARGRQDAQGLRRRRRLHPEGLPAQRHHGRHREARGPARESRVNGSTNAPFAFDFSQVTNFSAPTSPNVRVISTDRRRGRAAWLPCHENTENAIIRGEIAIT